jgi:hypothetical protein
LRILSPAKTMRSVIEVVWAEELQVGDVVHLHTDPNIVRVRLTTITRRTKGFKCAGYRAEDQDRISPWAFGLVFRQRVEIDQRPQ